MTLLLVALLAAAAWLVVPPDGRARIQRVLPVARPVEAPRRQGTAAVWAASAAAGAAAGWLVGGPVGLGVAAIVTVVLRRVLGRLESRHDRDRREALARQAPAVADLLAATLAAGVPIRPALEAVAAAIGEPTAGELRPVVAALRLGASPGQAWVAPTTAHRPLADAVIRSDETGAPLATMLGRIADDMRRDRRAAVEVAARSAGVRAVAPLAACFLPAFLLMGVVPVVASLAGALVSG